MRRALKVSCGLLAVGSMAAIAASGGASQLLFFCSVHTRNRHTTNAHASIQVAYPETLRTRKNNVHRAVRLQSFNINCLYSHSKPVVHCRWYLLLFPGRRARASAALPVPTPASAAAPVPVPVAPVPVPVAPVPVPVAPPAIPVSQLC